MKEGDGIMTESTATQRSFFERVKEKKGGAVIIAGSGSDESHIEKIVKSLDQFEIPYEVRVASAHKQPQVLRNLTTTYDRYGGRLIYIAVAGGTDALSGALSWQTYRPVISCPPDHPNASCMNNPLGSSNMYVGHPSNVGRAVAQMLSMTDERYIGMLHACNGEKTKKLRDDDERLRRKFSGE